MVEVALKQKRISSVQDEKVLKEKEEEKLLSFASWQKQSS